MFNAVAHLCTLCCVLLPAAYLLVCLQVSRTITDVCSFGWPLNKAVYLRLDGQHKVLSLVVSYQCDLSFVAFFVFFM